MTRLFLNGIAKKFCKLIFGKTILLTGSTTISRKMRNPVRKVIPFETRVEKLLKEEMYNTGKSVQIFRENDFTKKDSSKRKEMTLQ